jgi:hypothetical protein
MYDSIIKNLNFEKIKPLAIAAVCFAAVFIAGFGAGKMHSGASGAAPTKRTLSNYTTNTGGTENTAKPAANNNSSDKPATNSATTGECYIKGSKSKIYHLPGGSFYDRTNASQCFATEAEAQAAGYTKSSR